MAFWKSFLIKNVFMNELYKSIQKKLTIQILYNKVDDIPLETWILENATDSNTFSKVALLIHLGLGE